MDGRIEIYEPALVSDKAKRALVALVAVLALATGLLAAVAAPASAADGNVSGVVTDEAGVPLPNVDVGVLWLHQTSNPHFDFVELGTTDAAGEYSITAPSGTLRVVFLGDAQHAYEYYDDAASLDEATDLDLPDGGSVTADASLAEFGTVAGTVVGSEGDPLARAVALLDPDTGAVQQRANLGVDGSYAFTQVPAGSYKVSFNRLSGFAFSAAQFWDSEVEHAGVGAADLVSVDAAEVVDGVDATLVEGGHLTGSLQDGAGAPLSCRVQAFTQDGSLVTRATQTEGDGTFDIGGLTSGSYLVRVVPSGDCRAGTQYRAAGGGPLTASLGDAEPVSVTLGGTTGTGAALVYQLRTFANTYPPAVSIAPVPGQPFVTQPEVGTLLLAAVGGWTPSPSSFSYAWLADGVVLPGASGNTYLPTSADVGKRIAVRVTGLRTGFTPLTVTSASTAPVSAATIRNTGAPDVQGNLRVGKTARAKSGTWSVAGLTYTYTWQTGAEVLAVTTLPSFQIPAGTRANGLRVTVTASKAGYESASATSSDRPVNPGIMKVKKRVEITGAARVGATLTVVGRVGPKPDKARYTWLRDGKAIVGAKGATYRLSSADAGARIMVKVQFRRASYVILNVRTAPTAVVRR